MSFSIQFVAQSRTFTINGVCDLENKVKVLGILENKEAQLDSSFFFESTALRKKARAKMRVHVAGFEPGTLGTTGGRETGAHSTQPIGIS